MSSRRSARRRASPSGPGTAGERRKARRAWRRGDVPSREGRQGHPGMTSTKMSAKAGHTPYRPNIALLGLWRSRLLRLRYQRAVHLRVALVVKRGLGVGARLLVEHLGLIADEDPPGSGSHPVQDDGRRLRRQEPLV